MVVRLLLFADYIYGPTAFLDAQGNRTVRHHLLSFTNRFC